MAPDRNELAYDGKPTKTLYQMVMKKICMNCKYEHPHPHTGTKRIKVTLKAYPLRNHQFAGPVCVRG